MIAHPSGSVDAVAADVKRAWREREQEQEQSAEFQFAARLAVEKKRLASGVAFCACCQAVIWSAHFVCCIGDRGAPCLSLGPS